MCCQPNVLREPQEPRSSPSTRGSFGVFIVSSMCVFAPGTVARRYVRKSLINFVEIFCFGTLFVCEQAVNKRVFRSGHISCAKPLLA